MRRESVKYFFERTCEELQKQPYSLYFFLVFSKEVITNDTVYQNEMTEALNFMRNAQKNVKDGDIENFMYY